MSQANRGEPRVLVVGQDPDVLSFIVEELGEAGVTARGTTLADVDAVAGAFELVSFGAGAPLPERRRLEGRFAAANPATRFVRTYAPYAAAQILAVLSSGPPAEAVDLQAYCRRIGYGGPLEPTLKTLRALQAHHVAAIPFEAIDVLLDRRIDISPAAVDAKLIAGRRGGYCYEQNGLLKRVLTAIGFEVDPVVGSVRWQASPGAPPPPRSHMALRVTIDGVPWLVDVGFGSAVPTAPLRIDLRDPQPAGDGRYRVTPLGAGFLVRTEAEGRWLPLYDVSAEPMLESQYELFNWFASTHPSSHFRQQLIVTRATPEARFTLLDAKLTTRRSGGEVERQHLDAGGIERVLGSVFGLSPQPDWRPLLERIAARVGGDGLT